MYGGMQEAFDNIGRLMAVPKEQLEEAFKQQAEAEEAQFKKIMAEARLRQIEMYRRMKTEHPDNSAVQELCDKQLARLEAEGTGA
jgi:hypothetical protein